MIDTKQETKTSQSTNCEKRNTIYRAVGTGPAGPVATRSIFAQSAVYASAGCSVLVVKTMKKADIVPRTQV